MSRFVASIGAIFVWPMAVFGCGGAEAAAVPAEDLEILMAYIDPGVAGFVIVAVLGFLSSIGYLARSYLARVKQWLFGRGEADADAGADDDGEGENC